MTIGSHNPDSMLDSTCHYLCVPHASLVVAAGVFLPTRTFQTRSVVRLPLASRELKAVKTQEALKQRASKRTFQKSPPPQPPRGHDPDAVAPSTPQPPQGLSRRRTASADHQPSPSGAATASLAAALARERIWRRGEGNAGPEEREALPFWQRTWFLALLLAMAAASFALAILLYLGLDLHVAAPAQSYAADPDTVVEVRRPSHFLSCVLLFVMVWVLDCWISVPSFELVGIGT